MRWLTNDSSSEIDADNSTLTSTSTNATQTNDPPSIEDHTTRPLNESDRDSSAASTESNTNQASGNESAKEQQETPQALSSEPTDIEGSALPTEDKQSTCSQASITPNAANSIDSGSTKIPSPSVKNKEFKSTSEALIRKLLERSTPRLDAKLVGVLLLEGKESKRWRGIYRWYLL